MSEHAASPTTYVAIFAALLVLTGVTTMVAFVDFGIWNPVIAMSIACLKATLVVLFFMHLRDTDQVTWIVAGAAVFWLGILLILLLSLTLRLFPVGGYGKTFPEHIRYLFLPALTLALGLSAVYLAASLIIFHATFKAVKKKGLLTRIGE